MLSGMSTDMWEHYEIRRHGQWVEADLGHHVDISEAVGEELDRLLDELAAHPSYIDRDYPLFAALGNYRNTIGIEPIVFPRGLPDDVSESVRTKCGRLSQNPSWLTLDELLRFDWDQPLQDLNLTDDGLRRRKERGLFTYRDVVAQTQFLTRVIPYLQTQVMDPRDLRMVFWFD